MSRVSRSKPEVDERRRTTSNKSQPEDRVPAAQERADQYDDYQQQEPPETSPLPSGRTSELQRTDRKPESGQTERDKEIKLEDLQKKVSRKMALGRLRQAVLQQDVKMIKRELDDIRTKYSELSKSERESVEDAEKLVEVLKAARALRRRCDKGNVEEIEKAIKEIEENEDETFKEMLKLQVRDAKYVIEGLTKPPVRKAGRMQVDFHSFNELRRYAQPPPGVLPTMQAVFLLLGVDEGRTQTWPGVQRLCKPTGPDSLFSRVLNVKVKKIHPEIAARAKEIIGNNAGIKEQDTRKTETEHEEATETPAETPEPETDAETNEDSETAKEDEEQQFSAATSREANKGQDLEKKPIGIDRERLRTTCPVAWALLLWALDVVKQVECIPRENESPARPANVKRQRELLGLQLPRLPKMDRQYYHILAKNSLDRSYQQAYGTTYNGGPSYRNTFPPPARSQYHKQQPQRSVYYPSSSRRQDDDEATHMKSWRGAGPYRTGYDRSRDQMDREN